jgi:hypothetical protein
VKRMSSRVAAERGRFELARLVPWFSELADGVGPAAGLTKEVRSALVLTTADLATELGAVLRAELDRVHAIAERDRRNAADKVARQKRQTLKKNQDRFAARIGQFVSRAQLDAMSPTQLADLMSARWSDFAPSLTGNLDDLVAWIQAKLGAQTAVEFAERARPSQSDGDRVLADFVVEFGSADSQVFHGVTMTRSSISNVAGIEPVLASEQYVEFSTALYSSGVIDSFARSEPDLVGVAIAWREKVEQWTALSDQWKPPADVVAKLLAVAVEPAFANSIAEGARHVVGRVRGTGTPAWPTIGVSPVVDLVTAASAIEWESTRVGAVRALLESHGLLAEGETIPELSTLAKRFGEHWDLALDVIRAPEMTVLTDYARSEGVELPERSVKKDAPMWDKYLPGVKLPEPGVERDAAIWDKYLAEVLVALDPQGRPRFMGQSIARRDLLGFLGTGMVFVDFARLPPRATESKLRIIWGEEHEQRAARLFASGVMTVYAVLPGQTELSTLDELWHSQA